MRPKHISVLLSPHAAAAIFTLAMLLALLLAACVTSVHAQTINCNATIIDNAHIFNVGDANIRGAVDKLVNAGADPRVISDEQNMTPDQYADKLRRSCGSWQSTSGGMKNNLVIFMVFPRHRKSAVLMGSEYTKFMQADVVRTQYMNPSFRDGNWALGIVKGIDQTIIQIEAHQQSALHPATTVVNKPPTDFHGLWVALYWIIGIVAVIAAIWFLIWLLAKREATRDAQQAAVDARNDIAHWLQQTLEWLQTKEAIGADVSKERARYEAAAEDFARVSQSETYNPDTKGLSEGQYLTIKGRYNAIRVNIQGDPIPLKRKGTGTTHYTPAASQVSGGNVTQNVTQRIYVGGSPSVVEPVYVPVPIIEESYAPTYYDPPPQYSTPTPDTTSSWGGSSGSFGSDDSSSFDSGSSGSFDSGGSDSGGSSGDF